MQPCNGQHDNIAKTTATQPQASSTSNGRTARANSKRTRELISLAPTHMTHNTLQPQKLNPITTAMLTDRAAQLKSQEHSSAAAELPPAGGAAAARRPLLPLPLCRTLVGHFGVKPLITLAFISHG